MSTFSTSFSTIITTIIFAIVCYLLVVTVSTYTGQERTRFLDRMAELADQAEVLFDSGRTAYCQIYGNQFEQNLTAWSSVRTQCFENFLLEIENQDLDKDDPLLYSQLEQDKMLFDLYRNCAKLATNPCNDQDWSDIKKCARKLFMAVPAFQANTAQIPFLSEDTLQSMNVDHVLSERMMLAGYVASADIGKCTSKTLLAAA